MRIQPAMDVKKWRNQQLKRMLFLDALRAIPAAPAKPKPETWLNGEVTFSWLGHASVLINFYGITILTDPVLASRVGIGAGPFVLGPKRYVQPALKCSELPKIDLILISHCHFDHLDMWTIRRLGKTPILVAPTNTSDLFKCTQLKDVREAPWGQRFELFSERGGLKIEAFKTAHWGARMGSDSHRKWNGYVLERNGKKLIFGGDTAATHTFGDLRPKGPFELAIMPIGAYDPWITHHCTPEEALKMADEAGAKYILPIHHQTFVLSREPLEEPITRLKRALVRAPGRLALSQVGETFVLPRGK